MGFADARIAKLTDATEVSSSSSAQSEGRSMRCSTPSTPAAPNSRRSRLIYIPPTKARTKPNAAPRKKIMILGGGPNRIGQGIEFDYCCVHAAFALKEEGYRDHHGQL